MSPEWCRVIATYEARKLLVSRLTQVDERGYFLLIGALSHLFRTENLL